MEVRINFDVPLVNVITAFREGTSLVDFEGSMGHLHMLIHNALRIPRCLIETGGIPVSENREYPFPEVDPEMCKGCGLCIISCPKDVLSASEKLNTKGFHFTVYDGEGCIGCGNCFYACPEPCAITVYLKGYEPEEVS